MPKLFIRLAAAGFVLGAGLVSCSKENKSTDVYRTQLPVIRSQQGSQDLKTWDLLKNKDLDLFDELDFSANSPAKILIRSSCRTGGDNYYGRGEFAGTSRVRIWETLPSQVLTASFAKMHFDCGFEVNLYNAAGSNHVYTLAQVPLVERAGSAAQIVMEGNARMPARLTPTQLQDVRLRFKNSAQAAAKLICEDMELAPLPFEQVLDLGHFGFSSPLLREHRPPEILKLRPIQNCRALILERARPTGLSNLVAIMMPLDPPVITTPLLGTSGKPDDIVLGSPLVVKAWTFHNPGSTPRNFRFPKSPIHMEIVRMIEEPKAAPARMYYDDRWYHIVLIKNQEIQIQDGPAAAVVTLKSGQTVDVQAVYRGVSPTLCATLRTTALIFSSFAPAVIEELDGEGNSLQAFNVQPSPFTLGATNRPAEEFAPARACEWLQ